MDNPNIWIDRLSIGAIPRLAGIMRIKGGGRLNYVRGSLIARKLVDFIMYCMRLPVESKKIEYSLGDMRIGNRSMALRLEETATNISCRIVAQIKRRPGYKSLAKELTEEKVDTYFELSIYEALYTSYRLLAIIEWYVAQNPGEENILLSPYTPLTEELRRALGASAVTLDSFVSADYAVWYMRERIKRMIRKKFLAGYVVEAPGGADRKACGVAVHYAEGIDTSKRSDVFWYSLNNFDAGRLLLYFDMNKSVKTPVTEAIRDEINEMGIKWVALVGKSISNPNKGNLRRRALIRYPECDRLLELKIPGTEPIDAWIRTTSRNLLMYVSWYLRIYKTFNIRIVFDASVAFLELIAQNIALDFVGGIRIGVQRSTFKEPEYQYFLRYNPNHIFFVWGPETPAHRGTSPLVKEFIVSGYPFNKKRYDYSVGTGGGPTTPRKGDRHFTVALFDNSYTNDARFSEKMVTLFYRKFLEWLLDDKDICITTKEKKPHMLDRIVPLRDLIRSAQETGRLIRLEDTTGRFPSDASRNADIAIGIGISSAVTEAVVTGCRGIHLDMPGHYSHPYYGWGRGKVVFAEIEDMMKALKRYKNDPSSLPELGDWSSHINTLDPFRDGKTGDRICSYIRTILECLDKGMTKEASIEHADLVYGSEWGKDKIHYQKHIGTRRFACHTA